MSGLTTDFWVAAYLARLDAAGVPAHLVAKGEASAGAVLVKVATMNNRASVFHRVLGPELERVWAALIEDGDESEADHIIARQRSFDPDLWVVEVEDPKGRSLLDEDGLN